MSRPSWRPGAISIRVAWSTLLGLELLGGRSHAQDLDEDRGLEVMVPWTEDRAGALQRWWEDRPVPAGQIRRVSHRGLGATSVGATAVYLGYRRTELLGFEDEGRLAEVESGTRIVPFAVETWAPIRWVGGPALATWRELGELDAAGRLELRFPASDSPEGLVLGHVAAMHDLDGRGLEALIDLRRSAGSFEPPELNLGALLAGLGDDEITLAPVRELHHGAVRPGLEAARPAEGWVRLPLSIAFSASVEPATAVAVMQDLLSVDGQRSLAEHCGVEPLSASTPRPEWMADAWDESRPLDEDAAPAIRAELARRVLKGSAEPDEDPTLWFDVLFLLAVLIGIVLAIRRSLREWLRNRRVTVRKT